VLRRGNYAIPKIGIRGLDEKMVVIGHQAVSMNNSAVAFISLAEILEKFLPVSPALANVLSLVPPECHMVKHPGQRDPQGACHGLAFGVGVMM